MLERLTFRPTGRGTALVLCSAGLWLGTDAGRAAEPHGVSPYWGPEMPVTDSSLNASGGVGRMIAVDASGVIHVVYHTADDYRIFYTRSEDGGLRWSDALQLSIGSLIAHGPNIAVGPDGHLHVAWVNGVSGDPTHVYYRRFIPGAGWDPAPTDVSGTMPFDAETASISVDVLSRVHVAWHIGEDGVAPSVYYTRSEPGGAPFPPPRQISPVGADMHAAWPRFSVQGTTGDIVAVPWRDIRPPDTSDGNVYVAVSSDGGLTFLEHRVPTLPGANELDPTATVDTHGVIHLAYTQEDGPVGMATYQRSMNLGFTWSSEVALADEPSRFSWWAHDPSNDVLWLLWKDERDGVPGDEKSDLMLSYSTDGGINWSESEFVTDLGDLDARFPAITLDPDGTPYAIWADLRDGETMSAMFVRYRQFTGLDVEDNAPTAVHSALLPIVPNPARDHTRIVYELSSAADIRLDVHDVSGRRVRTLASGVFRPGRHELTWDGRTADGRPLPAGIYFLRLAGRDPSTRRLVLDR